MSSAFPRMIGKRLLHSLSKASISSSGAGRSSSSVLVVSSVLACSALYVARQSWNTPTDVVSLSSSSTSTSSISSTSSTPSTTPFSSSSSSVHSEVQEDRQMMELARLLKETWNNSQLLETPKQVVLRTYETIFQPSSSSTCPDLDLSQIDLNHLSPEQAMEIVHQILHSEQGRRSSTTMNGRHRRVRGVKVNVQSFVRLCHAATAAFQREATLVDKRNTKMVTVVGDLHGCLDSLESSLNIFGDLLHGNNKDRCLVFAGDFVDRGDASLEVLTSLLLLKLAFPDQVVLVRGNHEDSMVAEVYGFAEELSFKYKLSKRPMARVWDALSETFAALPLAVVTDTAFIVHGGLPSASFRLDQLRQVSVEERCKYSTLVQPTNNTEKMIEALLWSDPTSKPGIHKNPRGVGCEYGPDVTQAFLKHEGLKVLVRGHEPVETGYQCQDCGEETEVVTIFSAARYPNGKGTNCGAVLNVSNTGTHSPIQFS